MVKKWTLRMVQYSDKVVVSAQTGFTSTIPSGSTVIGNGTVESTFRNINDPSQSYGDTSDGGNVQISRQAHCHHSLSSTLMG